MKFISTLSLSIFVCVHSLCAQQFDYFNGHKAQSGEVVYKIKPDASLKSTTIAPPDEEMAQFETLLSSVGAHSEKMFPHIQAPEANCRNCVDLTCVHRLTYDPHKTTLTRLISLLRRFSFVEYAEPLYVDELLFTPNDTYTTSQWFMEATQLINAWDVADGQGNETVVIGIVDSGTEITHEDLINKVAYNTADPINGIDDDNDGYVDNYYGWDFGMDDNNPNPDGMIHGTCVAGLAAAEVNNGKGIAGSGFRCRFLPIKIANNKGNLVRSYEGVIYAALHGCHIINCSWGGVNNYSEFAREVVHFATFNCNALVVAAAGNSGNSGVLYPASYPFVLSVAASVKGDEKWNNSNYNYFVDVCAPTIGYMSTNTNNRYVDPGGGTSFSAPIVAGIAGLIKAKFPHYTAMQVGEQLRVNADDIYHIGTNGNFRDKLGTGRVNALNALTNTGKPSIRIDSFAMRNTNGNYLFEYGDTLEVDVYCTNYLAVLPRTTTLILDGGIRIFAPINTITIERMEMLETKKLTFRFELQQSISTDVGYYFKLFIQSDTYNDYEFITLYFNPLNYDFEFENFKATATANGTIGVYSLLAPDKHYGLRYRNQPNMVYDAGLLLATSATTTAAQVRKNYDYTTIQRPQILTADSVDLLIESAYKAEKLGITINQYIYGWKGVDALIHEYRLTNTGTTTLDSVRSGMFTDWIIGFQDYNMVRYIDSLRCAVISGIDEGGFLVGVMPLHYHTSSMFAYDTTVQIKEIPSQEYFTSAGIWKLLTTTKTTAGMSFDPNAVGNVNTSSWNVIGSIAPEETDTIRYAIIAGNTFDEIRNTAYQLQKRYVTDTSTHIPPCGDCIMALPELPANRIQLHQHKHNIKLTAEKHTQAHLRISSISGAIVEERYHDFAHGAAVFATDNLPKGAYIVTAYNKNEYQTFTVVITN